MGEELGIGILLAIPLAISPESQIPISPHTTVFHYALSLLEPRVSGCEQDFVHWSFKRTPVSLADSCLSLVDRISADFHSQMLYGPLFLAMVLYAGRLEWLRPHAPQGEPWWLTYPSGISATGHGSGACPYHLSTLPTSLCVVSSVNPWL